MKRFGLIAGVACLLAATSASGKGITNDAMAPLKQFITGFNSGDIAVAKAAHDSDGVSIMDEVEPHIWTGAGAFDAWLASLDAYDKAHGRTDGKVSMGSPRILTTAGDRGYAVAPTVYTFKQHGRPMREPATMTFALHRTPSGWKIAGWSWNGTKPMPSAH